MKLSFENIEKKVDKLHTAQNIRTKKKHFFFCVKQNFGNFEFELIHRVDMVHNCFQYFTSCYHGPSVVMD